MDKKSIIKWFKKLFSGWEILRPMEGNDNNCVDWVYTHVKAGDAIVYGRYSPEPRPKVKHVWLERGGRCYDNMHPGGFDKDDARYVVWLKTDRHDKKFKAFLMGSRI